MSVSQVAPAAATFALADCFQITAVAFPTFLYRFAAAVHRRTTAKGDSIGFEVHRCFQCAFGNW